MFKQLRNLAPRRAGRDRSPADMPAVHAGAVAFEDVASGPAPVLRPAAIFHQTLYDPDELTPVWARPRAAASAPIAASSSAPTVDEPAVAEVAPSEKPRAAKRERQPKAKAPSGAAPTRSKKAAKPDRRTTAD